MIGRMPILRRHHQLEAGHQSVGDRDHLIPARNRQGPTGKKVVLNVHQDQGFHEAHDNVNRSIALPPFHACQSRAAFVTGAIVAFDHGVEESPTVAALRPPMLSSIRRAAIRSQVEAVFRAA
ncbi:MAG: hypothetical protein AMXMBFR83_16230 [Phycisphaerae bacterium]